MPTIQTSEVVVAVVQDRHDENHQCHLGHGCYPSTQTAGCDAMSFTHTTVRFISVSDQDGDGGKARIRAAHCSHYDSVGCHEGGNILPVCHASVIVGISKTALDVAFIFISNVSDVSYSSLSL